MINSTARIRARYLIARILLSIWCIAVVMTVLCVGASFIDPSYLWKAMAHASVVAACTISLWVMV